MEIPSNLLFTKDHEWALIEGDTATIGITDHAQSSLGDVVFVELPAPGRDLKNHETFGVVESIKAVSDLYCPIAGTVVAINDQAAHEPALVNKSPYDKGWLIKILIADKNSVNELMKPADYKKFVENL